MRASILAVALLACTGNTKSQEQHGSVPPLTVDTAPPVETEPVPDQTPPAVGPQSATASTTAPTATRHSGNVEEVPGSGSCAQDSDCVLTGYQEGCCTQACHPYASSKKDLAARQAKEDCAAIAKPCPPPAPCRRSPHRYLAAKCSAGSCVALREPIAP